MTSYFVSYNNTQEIEELLMGHSVKVIGGNQLQLDNGKILTLLNTEGGCSCGSGDYNLTEINGVDNIITKVEFVDDPAGDYYEYGEGVYKIFVYTGNTKINLATWEGSDGNGYYGSGYSIVVTY